MFQPHFFGQVPREKAWGPADTEPLGGYPGMFGWVAWIATAVSVMMLRQWRSREMFFAVTTLFVLGVIYAWPVIGDSFHLMMPIAAMPVRACCSRCCAPSRPRRPSISRGVCRCWWQCSPPPPR
jgi:hypothetical protein